MEEAKILWNSSGVEERLEMLDTDDEDQYQGAGTYSLKEWDELPNNVKQTIINLV
jgi:hypothetical protein